jgi:diaminohydroxyphosphoribosylaminopyrimidine deaminase/5-amino-6-(5-phosphoribosylamino)uracil reductase
MLVIAYPIRKPIFAVNLASHNSYTHHALTLAARGLGQVAPNPAVGCVVVKDGVIVGRGWTQKGGRPHAETEALARAGEAARGATAYVTLEPCSHTGKTPPCAEALIAAGVARVVGAVTDPDPRVSGRGFQMLREAGIEVVTGICEAEAAELNAGFFLRVKETRPLVVLKIAESANGLIADASGQTRWLTSEAARAHAHLLRATHDAILIGIETALADDPELTCRLPGLEDRSPIRIVLDSHLRLPFLSKLAKSARTHPVILAMPADFALAQRGPQEALSERNERRHMLEALGVEILPVAAANGRADLRALMGALAARGLTRLLVEGGAKVHAGFLEAGFADRLHIYRAPTNVAGGPVSALSPVPPRFEPVERRQLGPDVLESYRAKG